MNAQAGRSEGGAPGRRFVTISATYGSGGSVVAPLLAERVGLAFADRLIPPRDPGDAAMLEEGLSDAERDQMRGRRLLGRLAHLAGALNLPTPDAVDLRDQLRDRVAASIRDLRGAGGAVLLGRAGAVVLSEYPAAFHVRLDGPEDRRVARAAAFEGIDAAKAKDRLVETDQARARYVRRLYGREIDDPSLYHLVVDGTVFSAEDCVEVLAIAAAAFWRRPR